MSASRGPHAPLLILGMDIGQAYDSGCYVGVCPSGLRPGGALPNWQVCIAEIAPLGVSYKKLAVRARQIVEACEAQGWTGILAVDATGVGRPVLESLREDPPLPWEVLGITSHGGQNLRGEWPDIRVPKESLVTALSASIDNRALIVPPNLPASERLAAQLLTYKAKRNMRTGRTKYEAAREKDHDDLVAALTLATFVGNHVYTVNAARSGFGGG